MLFCRCWTRRSKSKEELQAIDEQWRESSIMLNQEVCGGEKSFHVEITHFSSIVIDVTVFVGAVWQRTATVLIEAVAVPNPNIALPLVIIHATFLTYMVGKVFVTLSWIYMSSDDGGDDTVKWNAFLTFCRKCATESFGFAVKDLVVEIIFYITLSSTSSLGSAFGVWLLVVIVFSMVIIGTSFIQAEAFGLANLNEKLLEFESDGFALPLAFTLYAILVVGMDISPPYVAEEIGTEMGSGSDIFNAWSLVIVFLFLSVICPTSMLLLEERSKAVKRRQQKQADSNAQSSRSVPQANPMHPNSPSASPGKGVPSPPILPPHPHGIANSSLPLSAPASTPSQHHVEDDDDEEEKEEEGSPLKASMDALLDLFVTAQAYLLAVSLLVSALPSEGGNMLGNIIALFFLLVLVEYEAPYMMQRLEDKAHKHLEAHMKAKAEINATVGVVEMTNSATQSSPIDAPSSISPPSSLKNPTVGLGCSSKVRYYGLRAYRKIMHHRSMFIASAIRLVVGFGFEEFLASIFIAISSTFPPGDEVWANLVFLCLLSVVAFVGCALIYVKLTLIAKRKRDVRADAAIAKATSRSAAFGTSPASVDNSNGNL